MTRVKQFFKAIFAKITDEDKLYIKKYLSPAGEKLFFDMAVFDQAHALSVARTIATFDYNGDKDFLIRLALLHDVGRKNVSILDKVFCVLINAFSKKFAKFLSNYIHSLSVYYNHAQIGAELLQEAGFEEESKIICYHHEKKSEPIELLLLKKADNMN